MGWQTQMSRARGMLERRYACLFFAMVFFSTYISLFYLFSLHGEVNTNKLPLRFFRKFSGSSILITDVSYTMADEQPPPVKCVHCNISMVMKSKQKKSQHQNIENGVADPIEHDPTIDEGAVADSYKWYLINKQKECTSGKPIQQLVFVRCHRVASQTLSNIFYRYGEKNQLTFVLPKASSFHYYWPLRFHQSYVDKTLINKNPPNLLINIARNQWSGIRSLAGNSAFNVAILRDPAIHFQSVFEYIDLAFFMEKISGANRNYLDEFAKDPKTMLETIMNITGTFDPVFHLLSNGQLFDLGYEKKDYISKMHLDFIIRDLEEQFDLILITDYMDESLVLLQRMLCWDLHDVTYIKHRVRKEHKSMSEVTSNRLRHWNAADTRVYKHFNETLWRKIEQQDSSFYDDVAKLRLHNRDIFKSCISENPTRPLLKDLWTNETEDTQHIKYELKKNIKDENTLSSCQKYLRNENNFIKILKENQKDIVQNNDANNSRNKLVKGDTEGNFFYSKVNSTASDFTTKVYTSPPETSESVAEETLKI